MASFRKSCRRIRFQSLEDLYTDSFSAITANFVVTIMIIYLGFVEFGFVVEVSVVTVISSPLLINFVVLFKD
jgi:hypothetical protein